MQEKWNDCPKCGKSTGISEPDATKDHAELIKFSCPQSRFCPHCGAMLRVAVAIIGGFNLDLPEERAKAIETLGVDEYNKAMEAHRERNVVAVVNGHKIRRAFSQRWGELFGIDGTTYYSTQAKAEEVARGMAKGGAQ